MRFHETNYKVFNHFRAINLVLMLYNITYITYICQNKVSYVYCTSKYIFILYKNNY